MEVDDNALLRTRGTRATLPEIPPGEPVVMESPPDRFPVVDMGASDGILVGLESILDQETDPDQEAHHPDDEELPELVVPGGGELCRESDHHRVAEQDVEQHIVPDLGRRHDRTACERSARVLLTHLDQTDSQETGDEEQMYARRLEPVVARLQVLLDIPPEARASHTEERIPREEAVELCLSERDQPPLQHQSDQHVHAGRDEPEHQQDLQEGAVDDPLKAGQQPGRTNAIHGMPTF